MSHISPVAAGYSSGGGMRGRARFRLGAVLLGATLVAAAACQDSTVPNYASPTVDPTSLAGNQQLISGAISASRNDLFSYMVAMSSFGRDGGNFTNTDSRYETEWMGNGVTIPNSDFYGSGVWDNEFRDAKNAQLAMTNLSSVTPTLSADSIALLSGVAQTIKAYNFMLAAETRDTLGLAVGGISLPPSQVAPLLCAPAAWADIIAVLDSGEKDLDAGAGVSGGFPIQLPPGFNVASGAGPASTVGSFAGFNRALAAKAGLEYAYYLARASKTTAPTPTSPGSPSVAALTRADSAAKASFLFDGGAVGFVQTTATDFADPLAVYHSFSGASGDVANPIQGLITTIFVLNGADSQIVSAAPDKRAGKIITNSVGPGQPSMNAPASMAKTIGMYLSPTSPIPIIRNEDLVLIDAAIQLGLGNQAAAVTLINTVRTAAGATPVTLTGYTAIRDQLLYEFRASNIFESGEDRTIMLRAYGMQAVADTTWGKADLHTTVLPIPVGEASARNNNTTCTQ